jgi:GWxTD domain-containing protein
MYGAGRNPKIFAGIAFRRCLALVLGAALSLSAGAMCTWGQKAKKEDKQSPKNLDVSYREWLERDVVYIITKEERDAFLHLNTNDARDKFIERFWAIRNPNPGSPTNTYKDEIYERISFANSRFSIGSGQEGWRTPRGQTYITLGAPQQKQVFRTAGNVYPIEIWFYSNLNKDLPPFFYVMFYQREGTGDYRFYSPYMDGPDKLVTGVEAINDPQTALRMIGDAVGPEVAHISQTLLPDEPLGPSGQISLASDIMLGKLKNLANMPYTKAELARRRALLENVTSRFLVEGNNLDIMALPVRDSHGLTRLDYVIRLRNPSDLTLTSEGDDRYTYSMEVRVRVFGADNKLIFTQQQSVTDRLDKKRLAAIKDKAFGYEGIVPLPPGKYRLDFLLTDWAKKVGFHAEREVVIPLVDAKNFVVPGILAFSAMDSVDPAQVDLTPFSMAGVKFTPLAGAPLIVNSDQKLQVAYQIWAPPKDPHDYAGQKLDVEYALGQPAGTGGATVVKDEISMEQFDASGSLVNGKRLPLNAETLGSFILTVSVARAGTTERGFAKLNFRATSDSSAPASWDVVDPSIAKEALKGIFDQQRGLCYLDAGQGDEARAWFRRALDLDHSNDVARANLVDAYYSHKDFAAVVSLYNDTGVTEDTDSATIVRIAESLQRTADTKKAISLLETALDSRPKDGALYLALAGYYMQVGDAKRAAELTQKGKSLMGSQPANLHP